MATNPLEEELETLLDAQRASLRRLWITAFLLMLALILGLPILVALGPIGWGAAAVAALVAFLVQQSAVAEYRAANEAVARRLARR